MAISQRELQLTQSLLDLQTSYNRLVSDRDYWKRKAEERLVDIDRVENDFRVLAETIDRHEKLENDISIPFHLLSEASSASLFFGERVDAKGA
jgi:hypothetical protein